MCHVLIIEDDPLIAELIGDVATRAGATSIDITDSPATAFAQAVASPPAVIVSDVMIIDGTGPQAIENIRQALGQIPVVFLTASPQACRDCDHVALFSKPFDPVEIENALRNLIDNTANGLHDR